MVLEGEALGTGLGHEELAFMNQISVYKRDPTETHHFFLHMRTNLGSLHPRGGPSLDSAGILISGFWPPEL